MLYHTTEYQNLTAFGALHYNLETCALLKNFLKEKHFDAIAVELPEVIEPAILQACERLPDISVVTYQCEQKKQRILIEPVDPLYEALRTAIDNKCDAFCIDSFCSDYPAYPALPDPCSIVHIGMEAYQDLLQKHHAFEANKQDHIREAHMAFRLNELCLQFDKVLFVCGMSHLQRTLQRLKDKDFQRQVSPENITYSLTTLDEASSREVMANCGFVSALYEDFRMQALDRDKAFPSELERNQLLYNLFTKAAEKYEEKTGHTFKSYHLKTLMKFARNYALVSHRLSLDLFQTLATAKACVDSNYAYEVWELASHYPYLKNIDNLAEESYSIKDFWPNEKRLSFQLKSRSSKQSLQSRLDKSKQNYHFHPPSPYSICSHTPEDKIVEDFGLYLRKKSSRFYAEKHAKTLPFSTSLEDGIDVKETLRHWFEKKLYVKVQYKKPASTGSVVVIFDEDEEDKKYPWRTSWLGEHEQESDMAFYATHLQAKVIGPGISRCEYGGFIMIYPPRRLHNPWQDPDYCECQSKSELLLLAAIDYSIEPLISYLAPSPPRKAIKNYAARFGKQINYIPLKQMSPVLLNKIRVFHVLDSQHRRGVADEYIF
ncbi:MAG: hypothetical protein GWP59_06525 [Chlamydiales bacterium]|nr:hypothetical protein [Chlamydiales bacterium]